MIEHILSSLFNNRYLLHNDYMEQIKIAKEFVHRCENEIFYGDLSNELIEAIIDKLTNGIYKLINEKHSIVSQLAAISIIHQMSNIKCDTIYYEKIFIKFYNCLQLIFRNSFTPISTSINNKTNKFNPFIVIELSTKALGHLVQKTRTALRNELVDFQVKQALEWLRNSKSKHLFSRRLTAVLILEELAKSVPILLMYMLKFLQHIWWPLRDPIEKIRLSAIYALRACLKDLSTFI